MVTFFAVPPFIVTLGHDAGSSASGLAYIRAAGHHL